MEVDEYSPQPVQTAEDNLRQLGMRICVVCNGWFKLKGITKHMKSCGAREENKRKNQQYEETLAKRGTQLILWGEHGIKLLTSI